MLNNLKSILKRKKEQFKKKIRLRKLLNLLELLLNKQIYFKQKAILDSNTFYPTDSTTENNRRDSNIIEKKIFILKK